MVKHTQACYASWLSWPSNTYPWHNSNHMVEIYRWNRQWKWWLAKTLNSRPNHVGATGIKCPVMVTQYHEINYVHVIMGLKKKTKRRETNNLQCNKNHSSPGKLNIYCLFHGIQCQGCHGNHNSREENCPFHISWWKKSQVDHEWQK